MAESDVMAFKALLRVEKGRLVPHDEFTVEHMRERGYHVGDVLSAELRKPRNPSFNRLVHAFGKLCAENIEAFHGMDAHALVKRLQLESNVACDEIALNFPGLGPCTYRVPKSLSFQSMDEGQFRQVFDALVHRVSQHYWPECTPEQIEEMAEILVGSGP